MIMPKFNPYELEVTQMRDPYALFQPLFAFSKWYDTLMLNLISFCILKVKILIPSRNQSEDQQKPGFHFSPLSFSKSTSVNWILLLFMIPRFRGSMFYDFLTADSQFIRFPGRTQRAGSL